MKAWLVRLFAPRLAPRLALPMAPRMAPAGIRASAAPAGAAAPSQPAAPRTSVALPPGDQASLDLEFLAWIAEGTEFVVAPAGARERAGLAHLDRLIADEAAHQRLLPRAAAVIPPLLARLRNPVLALRELSQQVSRDVTLVAEVVRMANSALYRRGESIVDLDQAIGRLGVEGMRRAITRALLKPLIDARGGRLVTCSARRLWDHSDKKAQLCAALARGVGIEPFEAYLAGLAHNAVWSAVLRALDEAEGAAAWRLSPAFVTALSGRSDRLFAVVARQWQLADGVSRAAADHATKGAAAEMAAPMRLLYAGDRLAWLLCAPDRERAKALVVPWLRDADDAVRACYQALEPEPAVAA